MSGYNGLCTCVQEVMIDMVFNLGQAGFAGFNTFISLINAHNWAAAATDLKGTKWCTQVWPHRSSLLADLVAG